MQAFLRCALRKRFKVLCAADANEALDMIELHYPDAISLDVGLPGDVNGVELCEQLKNDKRFRDIYVILATGDSTAALANALSFDHANDFILKPFTQGEILKKLEKV